MMRKINLKYLPTDKDGGFAMTNASLFDVELERVLLQKSHYVKRIRHPGISEDHMLEYGVWAETTAASIGRVRVDLKLLSVLMSAWRNKDDSTLDSSFYYTFQSTVNTHKSEGEVVPRLLHCSSDHPMLPGMRLVTSFLRERTSCLSHLFKDTDDFLHKLARSSVSQSCFIAKFDVKDFFMSGLHASIAQSCYSNVATAHAEIVRDGLLVFFHSFGDLEG
jgi:hypothetical protein